MYMNMGSFYMHQAITCQDVTKNLAPCTSYFVSGGLVLPACCAGVRGLHAAAAALTPDRRTICSYLKKYALGVSGFSPAVAKSLPEKCGVQVAHPISANTDCSKV